MDFSILDMLTSAVTTIIGGGVGWFFGRRLYNQQVESSELSNAASAIAIYKELAVDLRKELEDNKKELIEARTEIKVLKEEIEKLKTYNQEHESSR